LPPEEKFIHRQSGCGSAETRRHRTKKEAIRAALDEYVRRRKQLDIIEMFGKIDYNESYDYKLERERNPNGDDGRRDQLRLL
jgi:hypothetical protein